MASRHAPKQNPVERRKGESVRMPRWGLGRGRPGERESERPQLCHLDPRYRECSRVPELHSAHTRPFIPCLSQRHLSSLRLHPTTQDSSQQLTLREGPQRLRRLRPKTTSPPPAPRPTHHRRRRRARRAQHPRRARPLRRHHALRPAENAAPRLRRGQHRQARRVHPRPPRGRPWRGAVRPRARGLRRVDGLLCRGLERRVAARGRRVREGGGRL